MKRFYDSFQKTGEYLWKVVFMHRSQHALHNAVQLQWMLDGGGVGWGGVGWGGVGWGGVRVDATA